MINDFIFSFTASRENGIYVAFCLKTNPQLMNLNPTSKQTKNQQKNFHTV